MIRLQKYLAMCGVDSRRACEKIIQEGRVKVNGDVIIEMGHKVSSDDYITFDDKEIVAVLDKKYYVMTSSYSSSTPAFLRRSARSLSPFL